jgi:DNA-directed RNA polymerase specialized sigma24 family protein
VTSTRTADWHLPPEMTAAYRAHAQAVARPHCGSDDAAADVATVTLRRLDDSASRNPAVRHLLAGPNWRHLVADTARAVIASLRRAAERRGSTLDGELAAMVEEFQSAEVARRLEELAVRLDTDQQLFLHYRYLQGRTIADIAVLMGRTSAEVRAIGKAAQRTIAAALCAPPAGDR